MVVLNCCTALRKFKGKMTWRLPAGRSGVNRSMGRNEILELPIMLSVIELAALIPTGKG
jgi:hypothetical protein